LKVSFASSFGVSGSCGACSVSFGCSTSVGFASVSAGLPLSFDAFLGFSAFFGSVLGGSSTSAASAENIAVDFSLRASIKCSSISSDVPLMITSQWLPLRTLFHRLRSL